MRKRGTLFVLTVSASLSATAGLSTLWSCVVLAANECVTEPNFQSTQNSHWYYRTDPVRHRKCWYVGGPGLQTTPPSRTSPKLKSDSRISQTMIEGRPKLGGVRANAAAWDASSHESLQLQEGQNKPNSSPDQVDRDALFREFVLWEALHMDAER